MDTVATGIEARPATGWRWRLHYAGLRIGSAVLLSLGDDVAMLAMIFC